jgi:hypothetical protein
MGLGCDAPRFHVRESALDPCRIEVTGAGAHAIEIGLEIAGLEPRGRLHLKIEREESRLRERAHRSFACGIRSPIRPDLVEFAIDRDHFAVQPVERPQLEIAMLLDRLEIYAALKKPDRKRPVCGNLINLPSGRPGRDRLGSSMATGQFTRKTRQQRSGLVSEEECDLLDACRSPPDR